MANKGKSASKKTDVRQGEKKMTSAKSRVTDKRAINRIRGGKVG
jgi:hypothetical protein